MVQMQSEWGEGAGLAPGDGPGAGDGEAAAQAPRDQLPPSPRAHLARHCGAQRGVGGGERLNRAVEWAKQEMKDGSSLRGT